MLDTILDEIKTALGKNQAIEIGTSPSRFGFVRDGLEFERGLHGFREWWAIEHCMRTLNRMKICDFWYTNFHTLHIIPKN